MPPKPKYTKEEIIRAAFEMTRESGKDAVTARALGKWLGTSSSPIFTVFGSMDAIREEVLAMARQRFRMYMDDVFDYDPAFKEWGMRWVRFAREEPNLYRVLFLNGSEGMSLDGIYDEEFSDYFKRLKCEVMSSFGLKEPDAKTLIHHMLIYVNGIAAYCITNTGHFSEEDVSGYLSRVCMGIVIAMKINEGNLDPIIAKVFAAASVEGMMPEKKEPGDNTGEETGV